MVGMHDGPLGEGMGVTREVVFDTLVLIFLLIFTYFIDVLFHIFFSSFSLLS